MGGVYLRRRPCRIGEGPLFFNALISRCIFIRQAAEGVAQGELSATEERPFCPSRLGLRGGSGVHPGRQDDRGSGRYEIPPPSSILHANILPQIGRQSRTKMRPRSAFLGINIRVGAFTFGKAPNPSGGARQSTNHVHVNLEAGMGDGAGAWRSPFRASGRRVRRFGSELVHEAGAEG